MRHDVRRIHRALYAPPSSDFVEVVVPPQRHLAIDGHGDPNRAPAYRAAVESLYTAGYAVRAALKERTGDDFVVGPLEGLWSSPDPTTFVERRKSAWDWTMLIPLPEAVSEVDIAGGLERAARRRPDLPLAAVRVLLLEEGRCLQVMHVGSYDDEGPVLARLHHEVMPARGLEFNGPHHEIYLGDPRRMAPERLKTVLRLPVR
jgi:hypothetical protein